MNIREILGLAPVIPLLTIAELEQAVPLARALVDGGLKVLEVALSTPVAFAAVQAMRKAVPQAVIGVGLLTRAVDFAASDRAGAQFGSSPGLSPELAAAARGARFPLLPGVLTPTELIVARHAGFNVVKLFPAPQAGGIAMLAALGAAFPDVLFCPSGGITRAEAAGYLALPNVVCVSGSWLAPPELLGAANWPAIESLARDAVNIAPAQGAMDTRVPSTTSS